LGQIRDLPPLERPREKAIRYGIESLSNVELLAIIIGSGTKKNSALEIASKILSDKNGLINIFHCPYQDFIAYQGLNKVAIGDEKTIYLKYAPTLAREVQEKIVIIVLNRQKKIVYEHILSIGSENNVSCSMRDILRILVLNKGTYFYLIHNHPGNIIEPSEADIAFTSSIIAEAKRIGFSLLDHLIIGEKGAYSFKTNAFLSENK
jgi:DNA repair protein RadC